MWSTKTKVDRLTITFVSVGFKTISMFVENMVCHVCLSSEFCQTVITRYKCFIDIDKENEFMMRLAQFVDEKVEIANNF